MRLKIVSGGKSDDDKLSIAQDLKSIKFPRVYREHLAAALGLQSKQVKSLLVITQPKLQTRSKQDSNMRKVMAHSCLDHHRGPQTQFWVEMSLTHKLIKSPSPKQD